MTDQDPESQHSGAQNAAPVDMPDFAGSGLGVAGRGILMGLAEVVPGVSGGTMAFITGIYPRLVASLASFGPASATMLFEPRRFAAHHNLGFLLTLAAGMGVGIAVFAQVMQILLAQYQPLVWAFFSGVILLSAVVIGRVRQRASMLQWGPPGLLLGLSLLWLPQLSGEPGLLMIFAGGAVAVCAWLLPAVSGSYVLLTLGLYEPVIRAIANMDVTVLAVLGAGCGIGLLLFAKALAWLLQHYSEGMLSLLVGFMLGSMPKLWPWQDASQPAVLDRLLWPDAYAQTFTEPAYTGWVLPIFLLGGIVLWLLTRLGRTG